MGYFCFLALVDAAAVNVVYDVFKILLSVLLGTCPDVELLLGSQGDCVLPFLRTHRVAFHSGCTIYLPAYSVQIKKLCSLDFVFLPPGTVPVVWTWSAQKVCVERMHEQERPR